MSTDPRKQGDMNPDDPRSPDPVEDDPLMDEDEEGEGIGPQHENPDAGMGTARK
ncbi:MULTISPECIES: hypothetical protein [unclassified Pseudomonas]|uniref:hypothetical protein n=1 Tax=unclassified Pseudomonas TaxID=196821 RepID=UPI00244CE238|nr:MULTISPECIES: hypothetical protein [unclassified Pseudomonas]MDH0303323.1 hypothetical protein [Pseudomonas sp. GD04091]MDH1985347.1 hypothetical protein [Pseudomonas sp. GD03689]